MSDPGAATRRLKVLVIDDEPMLGRSIRRMVGPGHDCEVCASAEEALAKVKASGPFDVIVCDVQMPKQTGLDFYEALEAVSPEQCRRIIFMSGDLGQDGARQFFARTNAPRLDKPFGREALLAALARIAALPPAP